MSWEFSRADYEAMGGDNDPLARLLKMTAEDETNRFLRNELAKIHRKQAMDVAYANPNQKEIWITTEKGNHVLLGEGGEIKAGFGGKFNGKKIGEISKSKTTNQKTTAKATKATKTTGTASKDTDKVAKHNKKLTSENKKLKKQLEELQKQLNELQNKKPKLTTAKKDTPVVTGSLMPKAEKEIKTNTGVKITPTGKTSFVKTAKGNKIETQFALVDAADLITSHDPVSGNVNSKFPQELQPRDRSRGTSQQWVQKMSRDIDPEQLGGTRRADSGAPIIGDDGIVESGNGRTMAVKLAYENGNADEYRDWLTENADYFQINSDELSKMKSPVLVRVRKTPVDRAAFAVEANQDDKLGMTATEKAKADAARITPDLINKLSENGDLTSVENADFLRGFMQSLGTNEAAQYLTSNNRATSSLISRVQGALFSKAYNDDRLLEMTADSTDPEIKNILNGLNGAARDFIVMQQSDSSARTNKGKETTKNIMEAINIYKKAKEKNDTVEHYLKQIDMFDRPHADVTNTALLISKYNRSGKKLTSLLKGIANQVEKENYDSTSGSMFRGSQFTSYGDILKTISNRIDNERKTKSLL